MTDPALPDADRPAADALAAAADLVRKNEAVVESRRVMTELVTTAVLPIVTLVLGFYFRSEKASR